MLIGTPVLNVAISFSQEFLIIMTMELTVFAGITLCLAMSTFKCK